MTQPQRDPESSVAGTGAIPPAGDAAAGSLAARLGWALLLACLTGMLTALHIHLTVYWQYAHPELLVSFEAAAPFQYRALIPAIAAALQVPLAMEAGWIVAFLEMVAWGALVILAHHALSVFGIGRPGIVRRMLALTVLIPTGVHLMMPDIKFTLVHELGGEFARLADWDPEWLYLYVYDLPAAVFTLGLVLLLRQYLQAPTAGRLALYLGVFALATFNRETTAFLLPAFLLAGYGILPLPALVRGLLLQALLFVAIQGFLQWLFADNLNPRAQGVPGTQYEMHLTDNLWLLANPLFLAVYLLRFGAGMYLPVLLLWRHLDPFLMRVLIGFGVPFLAFVFLLGRIQEHRVVVELLPLLWIGALQAIAARQAASLPVPAAPPSPPGPGYA